MELAIFFFASSIILAIGFPIIAYKTLQCLKRKRNCPIRVIVLSVMMTAPILAAPFAAILLFHMIWFNRFTIGLMIFLYPIPLLIGFYMFYTSSARKARVGLESLKPLFIGLVITILLITGAVLLFTPLF